MTANKSSKSAIYLGALVVGLLAVVFYLGQRRPQGHEKADEPTLDLVATRLGDDARTLQQQGKWCEAAEKWQSVLERVADGPQRVEAERNKLTCDKECRPDRARVGSLELPSLPLEKRPDPVPEDELIAAYPEGRTVRSTAYLIIQGKGTNDAWALRGSKYFHYEYEIATETRVVENRGTAVVFEQWFRNVDELRAVATQELEFHWPESPIITHVWTEFDNQLSLFPQYRVLKMAGNLWNSIDPNGKRTLTRLQRFLPALKGDENLEVVERIRELAGQKLTMEYVSGLGIVKVAVIGGRPIDQAVLERVARGSNVLLDYFVQIALKQSRDEFELQTKDVGDMFNLGEEGTVDGTVTMRPLPSTGENAPREFEIVSGKMTVEFNDAGSKQHTTVTADGGSFRYSPDEMLVRRAVATWHANNLWATTDHLLFGTNTTSDAEIRTYYEAELTDSGRAPKEHARPADADNG